MEELDLDTSWIEEEEKIQNIQYNYEREQCKTIHIYCIYVNIENNVIKIDHEKYPLVSRQNTNNTPSNCSLLLKENVLKIIQSKKIYTPTSKYKFEDVILYNVDVDAENIQAYENMEPTIYNSNEFFKVLPFVGDIVVPDTVFIFHELNSLFFIFKEYEFQVTQHRNTLKSILKSTEVSGEQLPVKQTKKVRILATYDENNFKRTNKNRKTRKIRMIMKNLPILENSAI